MALSDQARQADRAAVDEGDAETPAVHAEDGVGGGHPQVAPQRQLKAAAPRRALDGGDDRLGQLQAGRSHGAGPVLVHGPSVALGQGLQVGPGTKRAARHR